MSDKKTVEDLVAFLAVQVKQWKKDIEECDKGKLTREGALQCCEIIGKFLDGNYDEEEAAPLESETDAEEQAAEETP